MAKRKQERKTGNAYLTINRACAISFGLLTPLSGMA